MSEIATLETPPSSPGSPTLRYRVVGDQFAEVIQLVENGVASDCLTSVQEDASALWPANPPWQELHVHEQPDGARVLLLVGRAGRSHWSMSVAIDGESPAIIFDVACRLHESPEFLGSTYRETDLQSVRVIALPLDGLQTLPTTVETDDKEIVIRPGNNITPPATVRWKYRIAVAEFPKIQCNSI